MSIQTNHLKVEFNIEAIKRDFAFIRFTRQNKGNWYGAHQLDSLIGDDYKAHSVMYQYSEFAYAMFKRPIDTYELISRIRKDGDFSEEAVVEVSPSVLRTDDFACICEDWLAQILINSLASSRSRYEQFHYCNLTGGLFVVPDQNFKRQDYIDAAKVSIDTNNHLLKIEVKRYSKLIAVRRDIKAGLLDTKKINDYQKYVLHEGTSTLRRWLPREGMPDAKITYIPYGFQNTKAHLDFIDFSSVKGYEKSRVGILHQVYDGIQDHLSDYISIEFRQLDEPHTIELTETILKNPKHLRSKLDEQPIHIVDRIGSEESVEMAKALKKSLLPYLANKKLLTIGKRDKRNALNFRIIYSSSYYENNNEKDEYLASEPGIYRQHITIENKEEISNGSSKDAIIKTIVKEQLIKRDIGERSLSLFDWNKLNAKKIWTFASYDRKGKYIVFMDILPDGKLDFREIDPNSLDWYGKNEEDVELLAMAKRNERRSRFFPEGLIISEDGNKNLIYRTEENTLPDFIQIKDIVKEVDSKFPESMQTGIELSSIVGECFAELNEFKSEKVKQLIEELNIHGSQEVSKKTFKKTLNSCLGKNSNEAKHLRKTLYDKYGVRLHFSKSKDNLNTFFDSSLDIKYFGENESEAFYFVGARKDSVSKYLFSNACHLRRVEAVNGSKLIFKDILPTMDVDFVRTGQSTVLPFPFKYIREYMKMKDTL
jgi:ribosomal protein L20A (L18A)